MKYRARQTLPAPGIISFDARSSATSQASAALATHGWEASTRRTSAPAQNGDDSEVETVGKSDPSDDEGASDTAKGLGPAALAAAPAMCEGLSGAREVRCTRHKILGQGDDDGGTGIVVTQGVDGQITGHEAPKKQRASGLQAAQATGNAANHPAYWGGETRGRSWDDDSQDNPPAPTQKEDGLNDNFVDCDEDEDGPANGKDRAHNIVAAALKALAGDEGGLPALNIVRLDHGYDVRARALAALREDNSNVDPDDPYSGGCSSSLEESEGSDLGNSFDNSNVDPVRRWVQFLTWFGGSGCTQLSRPHGLLRRGI